MERRKITMRRLSRRHALGVCLAPVGLVAARLLSACGADEDNGTASSDDDDDDRSSEPENRADASDRGRAEVDASTSAGSSRDAGATSGGDAAASSGSADTGANIPSTDEDAAAGERDAASGGDAGRSDGQTSGDASVADVPWASGGTKSMQGKYPDPFGTGMAGAMCMLYPAQTLGPCYSSPVMAREDISDGITGLPLRLSFLVVKQDGCTPVPDAEIDIWHTGSNGVYSAFASGICNPDRIDVAGMRYCRGKQNTAANGQAHFSTVFPGWYTGRTIHIHFTVRVGGRASVTSQLYFEDALSEEIMQQVDYKARGQRDTTNRQDSILRSADIASVLFSSAKRADGALHAWKVLAIRS